MIGRVESLHVYPVKGMRGRSLVSTGVARHGIVHDRRWMVTDPDGAFLTQRQVARLAQFDALADEAGLTMRHGERSCVAAIPPKGAERITVTIWNDVMSAVRADAASEAWLSDALGRACRLAYMDDPDMRPVDQEFAEPADHVGFADGFPLLAANDASLASLNAALDHPVGMERFRPSVTISGLPAWSEDRWRLLRIGTMMFRAPKPSTRCVVITRDQVTGETPHPGEPLRTLGRINRTEDGIVFGANLIPLAPGTLAVGDTVTVLQEA
jgi:uncharacterized protein YcbX